MNELDRRKLLYTAGTGLVATIAATGALAQPSITQPAPPQAEEGQPPEGQNPPAAELPEGQTKPADADYNQMLDRECVLGAGLTEAEADCWHLAAECAGKFFDLPEMHPMERQEVASAIHVIQYRLLSRPTYRRYKSLYMEKGQQRAEGTE